MAKLVKIESTAQMTFTPPSGYVTSTFGEVEGQITELIKKSDGTITQIGGGGGGSADGYVVVDDNGVLKAQKLSFNGTEASFDGTAETLDTTKVGLFATTQDEPAYKGSGGVAFYKCASVDTANKTWTGYLAVLGEDGTYSFEETVTEGLPYTSVTPVVGKTYSADALVTVSSLYVGLASEGLILYAPFTDSLETETGQTLSLTSGSHTFTEVDGVSCINGDGTRIGGTITAPETFTMCAWIKATGNMTVSLGSGSKGTLSLEVSTSAIKMIEQGVSVFDTVSSTNNTMLSCFIWTFESGSQQIWKDGTLLSSPTYTPSSSPGDYIDVNLRGSLTHLRLYDRVLTDLEITGLSEEL